MARKRRCSGPLVLALFLLACLSLAYVLGGPLLGEFLDSGDSLESGHRLASRVRHLHTLQEIRTRIFEFLLMAWVFAVGSCIGSFLNVVIYRTPRGRSLLGSSRCPFCCQAIRPYDNVPVFGWLQLRGRCRCCRLPISPRYPLVEFTVAWLFLTLAWLELLRRGINLPMATGAEPAGSQLYWLVWELPLPLDRNLHLPRVAAEFAAQLGFDRVGRVSGPSGLLGTGSGGSDHRSPALSGRTAGGLLRLVRRRRERSTCLERAGQQRDRAGHRLAAGRNHESAAIRPAEPPRSVGGGRRGNRSISRLAGLPGVRHRRGRDPGVMDALPPWPTPRTGRAVVADTRGHRADRLLAMAGCPRLVARIGDRLAGVDGLVSARAARRLVQRPEDTKDPCPAPRASAVRPELI